MNAHPTQLLLSPAGKKLREETEDELAAHLYTLFQDGVPYVSCVLECYQTLRAYFLGPSWDPPRSHQEMQELLVLLRTLYQGTVRRFLTGINTLAQDDRRLTARLGREGVPEPTRREEETETDDAPSPALPF